MYVRSVTPRAVDHLELSTAFARSLFCARFLRCAYCMTTRILTAVSWLVLALALISTTFVPQSVVHASPVSSPTGTWMTPVPGFEVVKQFDKPDKNWQAGHRGIDVLALPGEPIRAPEFGVVRFAGKVAGKPVLSVEVGSYAVSYESVDTTLKKGERVTPGMHMATVSSPSHCAEGCVHVGVWRTDRAKDYLNPVDFFASEASILLPRAQAPKPFSVDNSPGENYRGTGKGAGPWGGHQNGRIPAVAMCPLKSAPGHMLRCDAARAFDSLSAAFKQSFGRPISVTDSYRTYEQQVILKRRKGRMAATPGRSNHGWGLAVDLGGGINMFGAKEHAWMRANAPKFGWDHPMWARQNGSLPEPWHWEFMG